MSVPKVAAIHDISGLGRCSLTAAIPVLAAMGVQACPLPTAVLSHQTGFPSYAVTTLTGQMQNGIKEWQKQGNVFDCIYTGFLAEESQLKIVSDFISSSRKVGTTVLIDPVFGDNGKLYPCFTKGIVSSFREIIHMADVITPNITEACMLAGVDYNKAQKADEAFVWELAERLCDIGPETVIISGVIIDNMIYNIALSRTENKKTKAGHSLVKGGYSGTGDILASIICGTLVCGGTVTKALETAAMFLGNVIPAASANEYDTREGIPFEPYLHLLYAVN